MNKTEHKKEIFETKSALILGVVLAFSGFFFFGGIYLLVSIFDFNFKDFINGIGIIAFYTAFMWLLGPVFGALIALGDKSWNLFKTWLVASIVAILINVFIATMLLSVI